MTSTMPAEQRQPVVALDLVRAAAALLVLLGHAKQSSLVAYAELPAEHQGMAAKILFASCRLGHEAVLVFFVLSGYLVGGRAIRRASAGQFDITDYAIERSTRIVPPLLLAIGLTMAIDALVFARTPAVWQAVAHVVGLNGVFVDTLAHNVPLWSLAYEIWFYALAGAACVLATTQRGAGLALIVAALATCVFTVLAARYLVFWCLGALVALMIDDRRRIMLGAGGLLLAAGGVVCHQLSLAPGALPPQILAARPVAEAAIVVGVCFGLPLLCDRKVNAALAPLAAAAAYLSSMSYTLYLVHFPLNAALELWLPQSRDLSWTSIALFVGRLAAIFLGANLLYLMVEMHTASLRKWVRGVLAKPLPDPAKRSVDRRR